MSDRHTDFDRECMLHALSLAARGKGYVEPNPMVGAVLTVNNKIVAEGFHRKFGRPHAEVEAIENARKSGQNPAGSTLYVTLEPCAHKGKTPPCTDIILSSGIKKVFMATEDPLWKFHALNLKGKSKRGKAILEAAGIEVRSGVCRDEAIMQNASFFKLALLQKPLVTAKWAMSADGKIATKSGSSKWISGPEARQFVHKIRGESDAVVIGDGTARADNPHLTCRDTEACRTAARIVMCSDHSLSVKSHLVRTARKTPVFLAFSEAAPPEKIDKLVKRGCTPLPLPPEHNRIPTRASPAALLSELAGRGASNILLEGGSGLLGSFFDGSMVDRAFIFIAPFIVGGKSAFPPVGGEGVENIKSALPFKGPMAGCGLQPPEDQPCTEVKRIGRDILLSGWLTDPRQWYCKYFT